MARPTDLTPEVVDILEKSFKEGANITQACVLANISRDVYYDGLKRDEGFADKMNAAQQWVSVIARRTLVKEIQKGNPMVSLQWLERKDKAEFAPRTELTGSEGTPLGYVYSSDIKQLETIEPKQLGTLDANSAEAL